MALTRNTVTTMWSRSNQRRTRMRSPSCRPMPNTSRPDTSHHAQNHRPDVNDRRPHRNHHCQRARAIMIHSRIRTRTRIDRINSVQSVRHPHARTCSNTRKWWKRATSNQSVNSPSTAPSCTRTKRWVQEQCGYLFYSVVCVSSCGELHFCRTSMDYAGSLIMLNICSPS